jgi:hypothetical protein
MELALSQQNHLVVGGSTDKTTISRIGWRYDRLFPLRPTVSN